MGLTDMVDAALAYAARGWPVFPLHGITDAGTCTCGGTGCSSPGKHPRTFDGFKSASTDTDRIRRWWTDYPDSNIGIVTGERSGVVVIDCDSPDAITRWEETQGPWTVEARTGKGAHYYYAWPGSPTPNRTRFMDGVDLRGDGGYVVAPPSRHASGSRYDWQMEPGTVGLEALPPALVTETQDQPPRPALSDPMPEGGRNATMTRHIGALFAKGHGLEEVLTLALALNRDKCDPPLPEDEVTRIVRNIHRLEFAKRPDLGVIDFAALTDSVVSDAMRDMETDYRTFPGWFSDNLQELAGPALPGTITVIGARSGCGKTTLLTNQARSLAERGHRVLYAGMEMPPSMLLRSLAAQALGFNQDAVLLNEWHNLPAGARADIGDWIAGFQRELGHRLVFIPDHQLTVPALLQWITGAKDSGFDIVMIDHLHEMAWGDPENLTGHMTKGLREIRTKVQETGTTLYAAAQLKRPGGSDPLEDYMVPPQSALKQSGAIEEVATVILTLYRTLKPGWSGKDLEMARRDHGALTSLADDGTVSVHCAKHRVKPGARDQGTRLYVGKGRLFDTREARDNHVWQR